MNDRDIRRLAEAVGYEFVDDPDAMTLRGVPAGLFGSDGVWISPRGDMSVTLDFDPENDANDDYVVLEFLRPENFRKSKPIMGPEHERWRDFIFELRLLQAKEGRESSAIHEGHMKGDYSRAYLKLLDTDEDREGRKS